MGEFIEEGGWGMYPVLVFGGLTVLAALRYAVFPHRRALGLLGIMVASTLLSGGLGVFRGVQSTARAVVQLGPQDGAPELLRLFMTGLRESLNCSVAAFVLAIIALLIAAGGALRPARPELPAGKMLTSPSQSG